MICDPWAVLLVLHKIPPHIEKKRKTKLWGDFQQGTPWIQERGVIYRNHCSGQDTAASAVSKALLYLPSEYEESLLVCLHLHLLLGAERLVGFCAERLGMAVSVRAARGCEMPIW